MQAAQRRGAGSDGQVAVATARQAGFRAALATGGCSSGLLAGGQLAQGYRSGNPGRGLECDGPGHVPLAIRAAWYVCPTGWAEDN